MDPQDVVKVLDEIGKRVGPAGEYAWSILVAGQRVTGIVGLVTGTILMVVAYILYRVVRFLMKKGKEETSSYTNRDDYYLGAFLTGGLAIIVVVLGLAVAMSSIASVVAPEYVILHDLISGVTD
jgi:ABC-type multidrug transport system permease subunit